MTPHFKIFVAAVVVLCLFAFGKVGQMDFEDALSQEQTYCKRVAEGTWPDYKGIYEKVCKKYEERVDAEHASN